MPTATHDTQQYNLMAPTATPGTWQGGDGSVPVRLPDNRTAWVFGDSMIRYTGGGDQMVHSCLVIEAANGLSVEKTVHGGTADTPASLFPDPGPGLFLWPLGGFVESSLLRIPTKEYTSAGAGTGRLFWYALSLPGLVRSPQVVTNVYDGVVGWGVCFVNSGSYTYCYGDEERVESGWHNHYTKLARWMTARSLGPWEFWDGTGWNASPEAAADLLGPSGVPLTTQTTSVIRYGSAWQALSTDPFGVEIKMRTASVPQGPFAAPTVIYTTPQPTVYGPRGYTDGTQQQIAYSVSGARPDYVRL